MEQKAKFILIGLVGALTISVFFIFSFLTAKQTAERERDGLVADNESLKKQAQDSMQKVRALEDKIGSLNNQLEKINRDKAEVEKKYELANKEKQDLIEKLKARQAQPEAPLAQKPTEQPPETVPQVNDAYWAGILKAKTDMEFQINNFRSELNNIRITNEQLQRDKSALELDYNGLKRDKEDLKRQLAYNQKLLDSITQELVREKNDKIQIQDSFKPIKNENTLLRQQLNSLNNQKISLDRRLEQLRVDKAALEDKLKAAGIALTDKVSRMAEFKEQVEAITGQGVKEAPQQKNESVELPTIVVRPKAEPPSLDKTLLRQEGSVLAINLENNFVIVDLGLDSGIKEGNALEVYRDSKSVATLEVIQARKNISACDIKKEITPIKIGDSVKQD